jgi:nucleoside-diphosphate-sugar epimerase
MPPVKKKSKPKPVLVTGAAGCVGAILVDELLNAGYPVTATDRPGAPTPGPRKGLTWTELDLARFDRFPELVRGVDAVIHTAAWVDITVPYEKQAPINLYAVRRLYEAAAAEGVSRFIHFSTGSLYAAKDGPLTEDDPLRPTSAYELTKLLAEDFLKAQVGQGPPVTILRPALIYGPRGKVLVAPAATLPPLARPFSGWIPGVRGGPRNNLVHALDVARAAVHLLTHPQPDGSVFNVASDDVLSGGQLMDIIMKVGGVELLELRIPFPSPLVAAALPLLSYPAPFELMNRIAGALWERVVERENLQPELAPRVDMEAMAYMTGNVIFDSRALKRTGFRFRFPTFLEGWTETVRWYRANRWLPSTAALASDDEAAAEKELETKDHKADSGKAA